jgi:MFS family permease
MIVGIILGVLLVSAFIGWQAWRWSKHLERMERDTRYRRRQLYLFSGLSMLPVIVVSVDVVSGQAPASQLLAAPIALGVAWFFFRAARRVEPSSKSDISKTANQ